MINTFFNGHNHTVYSNIRLIDCINKPDKLIDKAIEYGLSGIAITDHESLGSHIKVNKIAKEYLEKHPGFTIALGNEIYLTETRERGQKYYHFLLIAKDEIGYRALKELSSIAWYNVYSDRNFERVPTLKTELAEIVNKYKGHLIATTACIGGELSTNALLFSQAKRASLFQEAQAYYNNIISFVEYCLDLFGEDFYIECAPSNQKDQIEVNQELRSIAHHFGIKMTVGTDAHYLTKEDRYVHKAYLTSKDGDREVDSFYEFARLMTPDECRELLKLSFYSDEIVDEIFNNSLEIQGKIKFFDLFKPQRVTEVEVKDYPKGSLSKFYGVNNDLADEFNNGSYKILKDLSNSDNIQERYWVNQCFEALENKGIGMKDEYLARLAEEARVKRIIGEKLGTCMFAYPNTLQHFIDLFWRCGSTVGAGRGSACAALNHYLLGITQLDPLVWDLPFWRYLNEARTELGDVDLDLAPSRIKKIFAEIRKERGELGLVQVCTYGTETTKSMILTACRGYRSEEYPEGIDVDEAQYMSGLVPVERGFSWSLKDLIEGDPDKGRKPSRDFIQAVNKYPGLLEIMQGIEGLISRRGSHASGVVLYDNDTVFDMTAIMRTPAGALVTQWDLHDLEYAGRRYTGPVNT